MTDHALLLVNLGSPKSTSVADVRSYLNQFLMDPYVIDLPWPVRRLLVSLILIKRPEQSAHAYASIWWEEGSPLVVLSRRLQQQMTAQWTQEGVKFATHHWDWTGDGLVFELESHPPLAGLASFRQGQFYVQDPSTLLAVAQTAS